MSINKTDSKIGTNEARPNGQINVLRGREIFLLYCILLNYGNWVKILTTSCVVWAFKDKHHARNAGPVNGACTGKNGHCTLGKSKRH